VVKVGVGVVAIMMMKKRRRARRRDVVSISPRKVAVGGVTAEAAALDEAAAAGIATSAGPLPYLATIQAGVGHHRVDHVRAPTEARQPHCSTPRQGHSPRRLRRA
jgi:hypothetical protein